MYKYRRSAARLVAVIIALNFYASLNAQSRNCPTAADDAYEVSVGRPTAIRLPVFNADDDRISIFQPPIGGILEPIGDDGRDYIFIADKTFPGISGFTYRVTTAPDCQQNLLLADVRLVGEPGAEALIDDRPTSDRFEPRTFRPVGCGLGVSTPLLMTAFIVERQTNCRRRRRHATIS